MGNAFADHAAAEIAAAAEGIKAHAEAASRAGDFGSAIILAVEWRRIKAFAVVAAEKICAAETAAKNAAKGQVTAERAAAKAA